MKKSSDKDPKAKLALTSEQKSELEKVFGSDVVDRLDHIEIEQIAGFLKANAAVN